MIMSLFACDAVMMEVHDGIVGACKALSRHRSTGRSSIPGTREEPKDMRQAEAMVVG
jgi:hypothetical protein